MNQSNIMTRRRWRKLYVTTTLTTACNSTIYFSRPTILQQNYVVNEREALGHCSYISQG